MRTVLPRFLLLACLIQTALAATDITFFAISDTHYGNSNAVRDSARNRMPGLLNNLPGKAYPTSIGGVVATPRGVLIAGDLTDRIDTALWSAYERDYGVLGGKNMIFPTYEACGNHEFYVTGSIKDTLYSVGRMIQRNLLRKPSLTYMDSTGYHYSWDWDGVHFVNLNLYAGGNELGSQGYRPLLARAFLQEDLARNVGNSGRPVFIMQHYTLDGTADWTDPMKAQVYAILKNYNVIGILHGHSHSKKIYKWNDIDVFDDGTVMNGDMMVFRITDGHFTAINRVDTAWGALLLSKDISMGRQPVALDRSRQAAAAGRNVLFILNRTGSTLRLPAGTRRVDIVDVRGRPVRRVRVVSERAEWDGLDVRGHAVPPGIYFLRNPNRNLALGKLALP